MLLAPARVQSVMVTNMKNFFLFTLIAFSINTYAEGLAKVWELELREEGEVRRLVIELTDEAGDSCLIGNPKKIKILEGEIPKNKYFSGYSYSIENGVLSIDMFPRLCDGGNLLRGKIKGGTVSGEILSSSIAGLENVGSFNGKPVK